jgi:hypothetical protein
MTVGSSSLRPGPPCSTLPSLAHHHWEPLLKIEECLNLACQVRAEDVERLRSLESSVAAAQKELKKVQGNASGLQGQAQKLQEQIDNVGGEPLKKSKAKVESLQEVNGSLQTVPVQPPICFFVLISNSAPHVYCSLVDSKTVSAPQFNSTTHTPFCPSRNNPGMIIIMRIIIIIIIGTKGNLNR